MLNRQINNKRVLKGFRKQLRNHGTSAEATLWKSLQKRQFEGRKFRRQFSVENYILDYYCPSEKLAIELDGAHHYTSAGIKQDQERDAFLNSLGIKVLRFENIEVFQDLESVLEAIKNNLKPTKPCSPN